MAEIPESILRRSAEARAKAEGRDVEEVLAEMKGEAPPAATPPETPPPAPTAGGGGGSGLPESILRRSAEARAKAEGRDVEEVLAEMKGEAPPAATPPETPPPAPTAGGGGGSGLPESILRRSAEARAKAEGRDVEEVLAEMKGEAPAAPPAEAPAPAVPVAATGDDDATARQELLDAGVPESLIARSLAARAKAEGRTGGGAAPAAAAPAAGGAAPAVAPAAASAAPAIPEGVRTQRLLTVVKAGAIQQVKSEPHDKVNVWPHLLAIEFTALLVVLVGLIVFSVFVDAPLLEFANFNEQPNPSKAPWYFLGLQELLSYFDPQVAGVIIPGFGLGGLAIIPYIDRNPSVRPSDRKLAIMVFTFFVMAASILTIFGSFFRGPGFNFTFPWDAGIFFDF